MATPAKSEADEQQPPPPKMDVDVDMDMDMDADADADPITASYNIFLNPALPHGRRLLVLQQPNCKDGKRPPPTELRLKSGSGMVEVDVPLDFDAAYDREKGLRWGRILKSSMAAKNGGSHGLAGGFGFGAVQRAGRKRISDADEDDGGGGLGGGFLDWNEAVRQDKVLRTQTLGGQYPDADEAQCMVGVFRGGAFSPLLAAPLSIQLTRTQGTSTSPPSPPSSSSAPNSPTWTQPRNKSAPPPRPPRPPPRKPPAPAPPRPPVPST